MTYNNFSELVGKTLTSVTKEAESLRFVTQSGDTYELSHTDDCCESVYIENICGNLEDLVGAPITQAEESSSSNETPEGVKTTDYQEDSYTWTFYRIATAKGLVVIRWYGTSNGYYSESVDFCKV